MWREIQTELLYKAIPYKEKSFVEEHKLMEVTVNGRF